MATNEQVVQYLVTVDFPAGRDEIVEDARRNGAPQDVLEALRAMPPVEYASKAEVQRSALRTQPEELTPQREADLARGNATSRVAQHLRSP